MGKLQIIYNMAKILISLPEELRDEIDVLCSKNHLTRSEFIRQLIREELYEEQVYPGIIKAKKEVRG